MIKKVIIIFALISSGIGIWVATNVTNIDLIKIRSNYIKNKFAIEKLPSDSEANQQMYTNEIYYRSNQICSVPNEIEFDSEIGPSGYYKIGNCAVWMKRYDNKKLTTFELYKTQKVKEDTYLETTQYIVNYYPSGLISEIVDNSDSKYWWLINKNECSDLERMNYSETECCWSLHYNENGDLEKVKAMCGWATGNEITWKYNKDTKIWQCTTAMWVS